MKRRTRKFIALLLSTMLLFGMMPSYAFAVDEPSNAEGATETNEEAEEISVPEEEASPSEEEVVEPEEPKEEEPSEEAESIEEEPEEGPEDQTEEPEDQTEEPEDIPTDESESPEIVPEDTDSDSEAIEEPEEADEESEATEEEAEEESEEEKEEEKEEVDPNKQFKYRLLVGFAGKANVREEDVVLGDFENVVLLGFDSGSDLESAQSYYAGIASFASVDGAVKASANASASTNIDTASASAQAGSASINDNPLTAASEENTSSVSGTTIALVDTGAGGFNVVKTLSVLGDSGADSNGHGSSLASLIGEVNPNASIISIKALGGNGKGSVASVYAGIQLAIDSGADIIVLPFSARGSSAAIDSAISEAAGRGIKVVVAAGNDGSDASGYCPANSGATITVGALNSDGEIAGFSNYGYYVDAWVYANSTSEASAKVAAGLAAGRSIDEYQVGMTEGEEEEKPEEEAEEFETSYKTTTDSLTDGGVYIVRLRKDPERSMVQQTGGFSNGNKFVLSNGTKREDSGGQFKLQKINYNFYFKMRDNTGYIMSPEGGDGYLSNNGTKVHMWYKTSSNYKDFDQWWMKSNGNYYRITNGKNTGMHLQTEGSATAGNTAIHLWNATSGTQGDWIFERVHYYVQFNKNGGSGTMAKQDIYQEVSTALTANAFTRTGYTFNGWNTNSSGTGTNYSNKQKVTSLTSTNAATVNLYAKWTANTYTVKYDGNGSTSGSVSSTSHTYDTSKALATNGFSRTGYTFDGWNTKADGTGTNYASGASVSNLTSTNGGTVTLYAKWKANTWYAQYNGNGNTGGSTEKSTHTYDVAKNLTNNGFVKKGYSFNEWNTKTDGSGTAYSNGASVKNLLTSGTLNLYAQWKANDYILTLDNQNATSAGTEKVYYTFDTPTYYSDAAHNTALGKIDVPVRTGYVFGGYYSKPNGEGTQYITSAGSYTGDPYLLDSDATLFAKWVPNTYSVSMDANGGKLAGSSISDSTAETAAGEATFDETFTLHHPIREGYTFAGWTISGMEDGIEHTFGTTTSTDQTAEGISDTTFKNLRAQEGTVTLTAAWKANTYTVRFDANGGSLAEGTENPYTATFDSEFSAKAPTRPGYVFTGWKVTGMEGTSHIIGGNEATEHTYIYNVETDDEEVTFLNLRALKGETEITALWADDKYEVTYNLAEGSHDEVKDGDVKSYDYNKTFHLANPTRAGYKFTGWTVSGMDAGTMHIVGGNETEAEEITAATGTSFGKLNAKGDEVTMTATWKADDITVVLVAPEAGNDYTKEINYTYKDSSAYYEDKEHQTVLESPITVPTRDNYVFSGYYENTDGEGTPIIAEDGTIPEAFAEKYTKATNLYAGWNPAVYEITLSQDGATTKGTEKIYEKYTEGVFSDEEAETEISSVTIPVRELTIQFDANAEGEVDDPGMMGENAPFAGYFDGETMLIGAGGQLSSAFTATYFTEAGTLTAKWDKAMIKLPAVGERNGFTFDGWYTDAVSGTKVGEAGDEFAVEEGTILYAHWTEDPELYYEGNGGTGGEMAETIAKGKAFSPAECGYTRTGYSFVEWNTKEDGTGTAYKVGSKTTWNEDLPDGADHYTLYAQWVKNELESIKAIPDKKYTGSEITPKIIVNDKNGDVVSQDDYTLTWENNIKVGTATVTVTPKSDGNFAESEAISAEFNIVKADAEYFEIEKTNYTGVYDGKEHTIKVTAKTEDEAHAYKIGYGKTKAEAEADAEAKTASETTNSGYAVKDVADTGSYFFHIIPDNYEAFGGTLNASITPKALTVSGINGVERTYDGTTDVELNAEAASLEGLCEGDDVVINTASATAAAVDKNAGSHKVTVSGITIEGEDAANYTFSQPTDVSVKINKKEIGVNYGEETHIYDGALKEYAKAKATLNAGDIVYGDDVQIGSLSGNTATNVGTYTVKVETITGEDAGNYVLADGEAGEWKIEKGTNEVSVSITGWTYGKSKNAPTSTAKFGADTVAYTYSADGETWVEAIPTDAGTYTVKATVPGTDDYDAASATCEFTIAKAAITVTAKDGTAVRNAVDSADIEYKVSGDFVADDEAALDSKIETSTDADFTKAGKYKTVANWKDASDVLNNYDVTFVNGTFTVTRNDTSVDSDGHTGIYDGGEHEATVNIEGDSEAIVYYTDNADGFDASIAALVNDVHENYNGTDEEFEGAYSALATALAGSNYDTVSPVRVDAGITDVHYIVITSQSKPDVIVGSETIEVRPAPLTVTAKDKAVTYGDDPESDGVQVEGLVNEEEETEVLKLSSISYDYQDYAKGSPVGKYAITPSGLEEQGGKHNYEVTYKTGTLTVNPKEVDLVWSEPTEFNYNGTERSVTAEVTNALFDDAPTVAEYTDNAKTAIGEYTAVATALTGKGANNYTLEGSMNCDWSIVPFDNKLSVSIEGWTYGDAASEPVVNAVMDADKAVVEYFTDSKCLVKTTTADGATAEGGRPEYAGTYFVKASLETTDTYEGAIATEEFIIEKRTVEVMADNKASTYGEPVMPLTYQMRGTAASSDDLGITLSTEASSSSAAGDYDIKVNANIDEVIERNYDITLKDGRYTITKAKMGVSAEGYLGDYDGKAHGIKVTLDPNEEGKSTVYYGTKQLTEANYKTEGITSATAESVTRKDAGTTTIYYYVESGYYEGEPAITGSVDIVINMIPLTVSANDKTITYGDDAANSGVTFDGFVNGEDEGDLGGTLAYAYEQGGIPYEAGCSVGDYAIVPSGFTSANYEIAFENGTMTVEARPVTFTWDTNSYAFDGEAHRPVAEVANRFGGDDVTAGEYKGNEEVNVGSYVAEVVSLAGDAADNYVLLPSEKTASQKWKITKSENEWNAEPAIEDWTYGKTASTPTSIAKLGADTVVYEYKKDGITHLLDSYTSEVPTEAGNYVLRATVPGTSNYKELKATVKFSILPAEITISADSKFSMYRTALLPLSYTVTGDYVEGDELGIVLSTDATLLSPVGEYDINATWDENPNYIATIEKGTYTITKGYLKVSASDTSHVYDGQPHGIEIEILEPDLHDATVWYSDTELTDENIHTAAKTDDPLDDSVAQVDVGQKTVYYYIESENFEKNPEAGDTITGSRKVTITKADLEVKTVDQHITYGDEPHAGKPVDAKEGISYTIPTGCKDDLVISGIDYDYTYEQFQDVGEYSVTAKGIESHNYNITITPGKLVVGKYTLTFTWESETGSTTDFGYQYDGKEHKVIAIPVTLNGDEMDELTYESSKATNAGDYTAKVTALPNTGKGANYTFDRNADNTTQNWGIEQADNSWTVEPEIENWTYGKDAKTPNAEAKFGIPTYSYRPSDSDDDSDWTDEVPTKAGEYTLRAQVAETDNYKGLTGYTTLEINKAKIDVKADDKTSRYLAKLEPFTYTATGVDGDSYVEGDDLGIKYTCLDEEEQPITSHTPVGEYEITLVATNEDALNNYEIEYDTGVYTITKGSVEYTSSGWSGTYDGKAHGITVEVTNEDGAEEALVFYSLSPFDELLGEVFLEDLEADTTGEAMDLMLGRFDPTETEDYDPETDETTMVKGDLSDVVSDKTQLLKDVPESAPIYYLIVGMNYKPIIGSEDVTITQKALEISANDNGIIYGAKPSDADVTYDGFVPGEDESVLGGELAFAFNYKQYDDVGTYTITPSGLTSENYDIDFVEGVLTVSPKPAKFTWPSDTNCRFEYSGKNETVTATINNAENGDESKLSLVYTNNIKKNAGVYTAWVVSLEGSKAKNYVIQDNEQSAHHVWEITKKALTVTANDNEITYGEKPVDAGVKYEGFVKGEDESVLGGSATYTYSYKQFDDVGDDYTITPASLTSGNYQITFVDGTLTVVPKAIKFQWPHRDDSEFVYDEDEYTYDAKFHSVVAQVANAENGDEAKIKINYTNPETGEETNRKQHVSVYIAQIFGISGEKAHNYVLEENEPTATHKWKIAKAELFITANDHTITYGDEPADNYVTYEGFAVDEEGNVEDESVLSVPVAFDIDYEQYQDIGDGEFTIMPKDADADDYKITFIPGTLTVEPKPITFEWPNHDGEEFVQGEDEWVYDGKSHTVIANVSNAVNGDEELIELNYTDPETEDVTNEKKDVGEYTAKVFSISGDKAPNYVILDDEASTEHDWRITKAKLVVTAKDHTITYGDAPIDNGSIYEGFVEGEDDSVLDTPVAYDIDYKQFGDIDEKGFVITPKDAEDHNYSIEFKEGTLKVEPRELSIDMLTLSDSEYKYDGNKKRPAYELKLKTKDENGEEVEFTLKEGRDFEVSGDTSGADFGTHNIAFAGKGNFVGEISKDWRINGEKASEEFSEDKGKVIVETDILSNGVKIGVKGMDKDLALSLLTKEELRRVREDGETAIIYLEISKVDVLDQADEEPTKALIDSMGYNACLYMDIKVYKKVGDDPAKEVHDTGRRELTFEITVPDEFAKASEGWERAFILTRAHEGEAKVLTGPVGETTFEFSTSLFSGYTVAFKDTEILTKTTEEAKSQAVKTGDETNITLWFAAICISLILMAALTHRRKRHR